MHLTVLVDNNTYIDQYYLGEPAVSYYIEDGDLKLLFDVGYSDIFIKNADKLGIDVFKCSTIAISHGHDDHTKGLLSLLEDDRYISRQEPMTLVAHPSAFHEKLFENESIGSPYQIPELEKHLTLKLSKVPVKLTDHLTFLGEIPQVMLFEASAPIGVTCFESYCKPDALIDDTALVYESDEGLFIITGCSHSGICNIIEHAKAVTGNSKVLGVIGGFHLFEVDHRVEETIGYFKQNNIQQLYPCHCTSFAVRAKIHEQCQVTEVGVGMVLEL
jgi:7,8-dihydropterin-6-yl-methyl-4-(beta-D-ribofuranosyl)aminobenzene 5'-phosphate synthase